MVAFIQWWTVSNVVYFITGIDVEIAWQIHLINDKTKHPSSLSTVYIYIYIYNVISSLPRTPMSFYPSTHRTTLSSNCRTHRTPRYAPFADWSVRRTHRTPRYASFADWSVRRTHRTAPIDADSERNRWFPTSQLIEGLPQNLENWSDIERNDPLNYVICNIVAFQFIYEFTVVYWIKGFGEVHKETTNVAVVFEHGRDYISNVY